MRRLTRPAATRVATAVASAAVAATLLAGPFAASAEASAPAAARSAHTSVTPHAPVGGERLAGTGLVLDLPPGVPKPPAFKAGGWVLADLDTGDVIAAGNPHGRYLPASTLKTLTVLTTMPSLDPATVVTAVPADVVDGTLVGLSPGSPYTVQQLLQGAMLNSGNDAATALARAAGGVPQTVAAMQQQARRLGALDTTVHNPTGLDAPGQLTSAYDLALVAKAALQVPGMRELVATKRVRFPGKLVKGKKRGSYQIQNHNRLLYNYPGTIGVKDGYTEKARWTAIGAVTRGRHTYVLTALHRGDSTWRSEAAMFDWAFRYGAQARPVGHLVTPEEVAAAAVATPTAVAAPARADGTASAATTQPSTRLRDAVGIGGLSAAVLAVALLALSARARRRQLNAARLARSARQSAR